MGDLPGQAEMFLTRGVTSLNVCSEKKERKKIIFSLNSKKSIQACGYCPEDKETWVLFQQVPSTSLRTKQELVTNAKTVHKAIVTNELSKTGIEKLKKDLHVNDYS